MLMIEYTIGNLSTSMLVDSRSTVNFKLSEFASKLGTSYTKIEPCKAFLPNGKSGPINYRLLEIFCGYWNELVAL